MHPKNRITEHDRERLDGELNKIHLAAVDSMSGHVQALRGKWYPGADDGPVVQYRPKYETRKEARP